VAKDKFQLVSFKCPPNSSKAITDFYPRFILEHTGEMPWKVPPPVGTILDVGGINAKPG